jgi:hypothetical protein
MGDKIQLNHHSAAVIPFFLGDKGDIHFVFEQKDPAYKKPFFDGALNGEGGNFEKGVHTDKSPEMTLMREVREEFWDAYEAPESLNALLGQEFLTREPQVAVKYDDKSVKRLKGAMILLTERMKYSESYIMTVQPPITKTELKYGSSIFVKQLSKEERSELEAMIKDFDGKLTTDNLKWGSKIGIFSLKDINEKNMKFSWGYCGVINMLLRREYLPRQPMGVIRPLNLVQMESMSTTVDFLVKPGVPSYESFEMAHEYLVKQKK